MVTEGNVDFKVSVICSPTSDVYSVVVSPVSANYMMSEVVYYLIPAELPAV